MKRFLTESMELFKKINEDQVMVYAAQSSFYLIISSIPFLMLLLSVSQYFLPISESAAFGAVRAIFPSATQPLVELILSEIFSKSGASLVSVTAISALWSASRGFAAVERGVKKVYRLPPHRFFVIDMLISLLYTLALICALVLSLAALVFGGSILSMLEAHIPHLIHTLHWIRYPANLSILIFFFAMIYQTFSGRKIRFRHQLPGAVFTAIGWVVFSWAFSIYIERFANYSYIYGSLAALVLLMLWLYSCMIILLCGAEVNMRLLFFETQKKEGK